MKKIQTVDSNKYTPEISLLKGNYTKSKPNFYDKKDISCGRKSFKKSEISHSFKAWFVEIIKL